MNSVFKDTCRAIACAAGLGTSLSAETTQNQVFEIRAFLEACTDLVPNVPLAIPIDAQCISQARKMCDLAASNSDPEECLAEVTKWMQDVATAKWLLIPEDIRSDCLKPPTSAEFKNDGMMPAIGGMMPDCAKVEVNGVSTQSVCEYSDALAGWHALRILQRAASETNQ